MRLSFFTVFCFLLLLLTGSCNQAGKPVTSEADSTAVEAVDVNDGKHTKEYITQRLKPTPTKSPDFSALPNFMPIHKPMTVKMIGIITLAPKLMI